MFETGLNPWRIQLRKIETGLNPWRIQLRKIETGLNPWRIQLRKIETGLNPWRIQLRKIETGLNPWRIQLRHAFVKHRPTDRRFLIRSWMRRAFSREIKSVCMFETGLNPWRIQLRKIETGLNPWRIQLRHAFVADSVTGCLREASSDRISTPMVQTMPLVKWLTRTHPVGMKCR